MTLVSRRIMLVGGAVVMLLLVVVYAVFDPATMPFPRCPLLVVSGFKCPGCGSQRAIHALLHGDIASAWHVNALFVIALPLVAALLVGELMRGTHPGLYDRLNSRWIIMICFVVIIAWWIGRNIWNC